MSGADLVKVKIFFTAEDAKGAEESQRQSLQKSFMQRPDLLTVSFLM